MTASDFKLGWDAVVKRECAKAQAAGVSEVADDLLPVFAPREILYLDAVPAKAARFLVEAGLPRSCAPFLSFKVIASGPPSLVQHYGLDQVIPSDVSHLAFFYVIGSDGAGNPLCVDSAGRGEVWMLDHEDGFRTQTFVASSVAALAHALLILHSFPHAEFTARVRLFDPRAALPSALLPAKLGMMMG